MPMIGEARALATRIDELVVRDPHALMEITMNAAIHQPPARPRRHDGATRRQAFQRRHAPPSAAFQWAACCSVSRRRLPCTPPTARRTSRSPIPGGHGVDLQPRRGLSSMWPVTGASGRPSPWATNHIISDHSTASANFDVLMMDRFRRGGLHANLNWQANPSGWTGQSLRNAGI